MFKRIKYTTKQKKDMSLIYFIIAGLMLVGMIVAGSIEGVERSFVIPLVLMVTSFSVGMLYRRDVAREENREAVDQIKREYGRGGL
ncbi:hypothetical protein [Mesobacillus jeotgali]|uniref:YiaAB two helix domain-containing protein n=1 Tax=Mesobacillus jeotgali TaxID=129985 RepID=A0ABY9VIH6_9BACI|nr:hypothetical protein [Mesobacillus jeotgali]WNF23378.1 hypothetical protein RH061_02390 [Mesobacillus jeotgali]